MRPRRISQWIPKPWGKGDVGLGVPESMEATDEGLILVAHFVDKPVVVSQLEIIKQIPLMASQGPAPIGFGRFLIQKTILSFPSVMEFTFLLQTFDQIDGIINRSRKRPNCPERSGQRRIDREIVKGGTLRIELGCWINLFCP